MSNLQNLTATVGRVVGGRCANSLPVAIAAALILASAPHAPAQVSRARPLIKAVLELATVVTAAKLSEEASVNLNEYWANAAPAGDSIYSVSFNFDRASWADFWSKPDVFLVIECEGVPRYLVPEIEYDWNYGQKIYTFRCPTLPAGSQCVLKLYDDDSASDKIWKNVLTTRVNWTANAGVTAKAVVPALPAAGTACLEAKALANGKLELLTPGDAQNLVLDAPDLMASAEFSVPTEAPTDKWEMNGAFRNAGKEMGKVSFTHWRTMVPAAKPLLPPKVVFWGVLLVGLVFVAAWGFGRRHRGDFPTAEK